jgi:hypothetical protein
MFKKQLQKMIAVASAICLISIQGVIPAQAAELQNVKSNDVSFVQALSSANANIVGDGVRLRTSPSTGGSILELMYNNEEISVDFVTSWSQSNGTWFYVKRMSTGTWGWVSRDYINFWD